MKQLKYVKIEGDFGQYHIVMFDGSLSHDTFAPMNPISAGFCIVHSDWIECSGYSASLKLDSDERDSFIATQNVFGIQSCIKNNLLV
jgi:hypothetical protein